MTNGAFTIALQAGEYEVHESIPGGKRYTIDADRSATITDLEPVSETRYKRTTVGRAGKDGVDGQDGADGPPGPKGDPGEPGAPGAAGHRITTGENLYYLPSPAGSGSNVGRGLNTLVAYPWSIDRTITINRVGIKNDNTATNGKVRIGVYADDGSGRPGALIQECGVFDCSSTTGYKELTVSLTLTAGVYWLASVGQGAAVGVNTVPATVTPSQPYRAGEAVGPFNLLGYTFGGPIRYGITGALPAQFTPALNDVTPGGTVCAWVVRVA